MIRVQLGTIWVYLRTMKRGYLENDQVEPGVCRGGVFPKGRGTAGNK